MKLGRKKTPPVEPAGRRRPQGESQGSRPQAFSYYARRASPEANTGRTEVGNARAAVAIPDDARTKLVSGAGIIGVFLLIILGTMLSGQPKIVLVKNGDSAYFLQPTTAYQAAAQKSLDSSILNKNKLTIHTGKVSADLKNDYPEIKTATVVLPAIGMQPSVLIEPYRPSFILTTSASTAYLLDESGRALVSVSQITDVGELSVPTIQDNSGIHIKLGDQVLPRTTVAFIEEVVSILHEQQIETSSIVLPTAASEVDIYLTGKPYAVKLNLQGDARLQAGTLVATKLKLDKEKVIPSQYIDVRVPERAYIR